jgi:hypothetical protein
MSVKPSAAASSDHDAPYMAKAMERLGDILEAGQPAKKKTLKVFVLMYFPSVVCMFSIIQAEDYDIYKRLGDVDIGDLPSNSVPCLELLDFLKTRKKENPDEVPYVCLRKYCVPSWST